MVKHFHTFSVCDKYLKWIPMNQIGNYMYTFYLEMWQPLTKTKTFITNFTSKGWQAIVFCKKKKVFKVALPVGQVIYMIMWPRTVTLSTVISFTRYIPIWNPAKARSIIRGTNLCKGKRSPIHVDNTFWITSKGLEPAPTPNKRLFQEDHSCLFHGNYSTQWRLTAIIQ